MGECFAPRLAGLRPRSRLRVSALSGAIAFAFLTGCGKPAKVPAAVRSDYWTPAITDEHGNMRAAAPAACIPADTQIITIDTPTIFPKGEKCPKGWKGTMIYYKGPLNGG